MNDKPDYPTGLFLSTCHLKEMLISILQCDKCSQLEVKKDLPSKT